MSAEPPLSREDVVPSLWFEYLKTREYWGGRKKAIDADNPIVLRRQKEGLKMVYDHIAASFRKHEVTLERLRSRTDADWYGEWKHMHNALFKRTLRQRGKFRAVDVTFGGPGGIDGVDYYGIPHYQEVVSQLGIMLREHVYPLLELYRKPVQEQLGALARVHYQFIRIHPFKDGNGRIARAITDQLALALGLPAAMGGYPRSDERKKRVYHEAIQQCAKDPSCRQLADWIGGLIEQRIRDYA